MSFSKHLPRMAAFIHNRMLLPYPTRLTEIPWYHQLPRPCKNPPTVSSLFSLLLVGFIHGAHTAFGSHVSEVLDFKQMLFAFVRNWAHCPESVCSEFAYFLPCGIICSCIPCISRRVEASSRNSFDEVQVFWLRVHRTYWAPPIVLIGKAQSGSVFTLHDNGGVKRYQPDPSAADFPFNLSCNDFICPLCRSNQWFH